MRLKSLSVKNPGKTNYSGKPTIGCNYSVDFECDTDEQAAALEAKLNTIWDKLATDVQTALIAPESAI